MKFLKDIILKKKLRKKFIFLFKNGKKNCKKKEIILTEFANNTFNHIASAYICDIISKKYSDLPDLSVKALYIAAWLCDDVLNKNRTALKLYREICEKFPDSEYCLNNVKPRIQAYENKLNELSQDNSGKKQEEEPVQRGE